MERANAIHLYTSQHPLTHVRKEEDVNTCMTKINLYMDKEEGNNNFRINCENHDSKSRPWALVSWQPSCTSQRN
jgi:hypothetical protein